MWSCLVLLPALSLADDPPPEDGDEPEAGEVIVVTGTRTEQRLSDATVATEVVTRAEIEASGARNAAELLATHAGFDIGQSFRGQSAELRGLDSSYVLVLVDGMRVAGRTDGAVDLSRFSAADIEQIEIVKGPASALYGADALAGVVHIRTRKAKRPWEITLDATGGSRALSDTEPATEVDLDGLAPVMHQGLDRLDLNAGLGLNRERLTTRGTASLRTRAPYDLDASDIDSNGSAWREWGLGQTGELRLSEAARLGGQVGYRRRESRGIDPGVGGAVYNQINLVEDFQAGLTPDWVLERTRVRVGGRYAHYRDQFLQDQRGSDALDTYTDSREHLGELELQVDRVLGEQHLLTGGLDGLYESLHSDRLEIEGGLATRQRGALFLQDEWTALREPTGRRLVVLPGARLDLDTQFGVHATPKLAVRFDPRAGLALRATGGAGYRAPDFKELYLLFENPTAGYKVEGNPDLQPETSWSGELSANWEPRADLRLGLSGYWNEIDNLIEPELVADDDEADGVAPYRMSNVAQAFTRGLDLSAGYRVRQRWIVDASYNLLDTRDRSLDLPLEGRAPHRVTLEATALSLAAGLDLTLRGAWSSAAPYYDELEGTTYSLLYADPTTLLGARVGRRFGADWTAFLGVDNLLDQGDATYNRLEPRLVYLGLSTRLGPQEGP